MKKLEKLLTSCSLVLGFLSIAFFVFDYFVFLRLQPKMARFQPISGFEENLMNCVGIGLLVFLAFCLLTLWQIAKYLKSAKTITFFSLVLVVAGVFSLLFVFANVALLGDIGKQYRYGMSQPEWCLVFPLMSFQFLTAIIFTFLHLSGFFGKKQLDHVARDSNIFLVVQYVGIVCGAFGLFSTSLGFLFPRAWSLLVHTTIGSITLLIPYLLAVGFWLITKFQEKPRGWYDEKQLQDVGKSALVTLVLGVVFMTVLFVGNYNNLGGVVSILWLPLYLFFVLLLFSLGNLYFSRKNF